MAKSILHVANVLAWADEHHARTGALPKASSGVVAANPNEKWHNIDQALRQGCRGFPGGWSLPQLLAERRGHRNRKNLPRYKPRTILGWADAHRQRHGRWPTAKSGPIKDARGETWLAVDMALRHGRRGLPGGSSLADLLAKGRDARNRRSVPRLSKTRILWFVDSHKKRTGSWPTHKSGEIPESPGDTWCAIDLALRQGHRGLPGGTSLARLLSQRRGVKRHKRESLLSIAMLLAWADAHHSRTRRWPTRESGAVREAPGETWSRIDKALKQGKRGLPGRCSLATFLSVHRGVRNSKAVPPLRLKTILNWVNDHVRRHGKYPHRDSGLIPNSGGETWSAVSSALTVGRRGLSGGSSLAKVVQQRVRRGK